MTIYHTRPFNAEYVIWQPSKRLPEAARRTHRTAKANYWYINRTWGIDDVGPTPDWAVRKDLVVSGRCGPQRANDPAIEGIALWAMMDDLAKQIRPDEATMVHAVGSLPLGETADGWKQIVEGFCEDHLVSQGMVVDWAVHRQAGTEQRREILPHVHMLITTRVYDRHHPELGRRRQNWIRTPQACKRLADKWFAHTRIYPIGQEPLRIAA